MAAFQLLRHRRNGRGRDAKDERAIIDRLLLVVDQVYTSRQTKTDRGKKVLGIIFVRA